MLIFSTIVDLLVIIIFCYVIYLLWDYRKATKDRSSEVSNNGKKEKDKTNVTPPVKGWGDNL